MLNPFEECPFLILGLPMYVDEDHITRRWNNIISDVNADPNNTSELKKIKISIYNNAKARANAALASTACELARDDAEQYTDEDFDTVWDKAKEKGELYVTLCEEQWRAGYQRERHNKKEAERMELLRANNDAEELGRVNKIRTENNAVEQERVDKMRAGNDSEELERVKKLRAENDQRILSQREENDKAEQARMEGVRAEHDEEEKRKRAAQELKDCKDDEVAEQQEIQSVDDEGSQPGAKKRKHVKTWGSEQFQALKKQIEDFVQHNITLKEGSFISCKELLKAFTKKNGIDELDSGFFYRHLKYTTDKIHSGGSWTSVIHAGNRGYKGMSLHMLD